MVLLYTKNMHRAPQNRPPKLPELGYCRNKEKHRKAKKSIQKNIEKLEKNIEKPLLYTFLCCFGVLWLVRCTTVVNDTDDGKT